MRFKFVEKARLKIMIFAALMLLVLASSGMAQYGGDTVWTRNYGDAEDQWAYSADLTSDGGFIISAYTGGYDTADFWLIKTDSNGDTLWTRTYGTAESEHPQSVKQTYDGGYIMAGWVLVDPSGINVYRIYVVKTDADGDTLWTRVFGAEGYAYAFDVEQMPDSGYVIFGQTGDFDFDDYDACLMRLDANGDSLWMQVYGTDEDESGNDVELTLDGGFIMTGHTGNCADQNLYLIKADADGDSLWGYEWGAPGEMLDEGYSVEVAFDGSYIVAGYTQMASDDTDDIFIKLDSDGDVIWTERYGEGGYPDFAYSICETPDGGYVAAGDRWLGARGAGVYVLRLDVNGDTLWTRLYGSSACWNGATSVIKAADSTYLAVGRTCTVTNNEQVYMVNFFDGPHSPGCDYIIGDVNGSSSYNGLDVTYGVAFFKGGPAPMCTSCPPCAGWHYCGDVNASCSYNGLDITYGVAYFKGGAAPMPCGDCPPTL